LEYSAGVNNIFLTREIRKWSYIYLLMTRLKFAVGRLLSFFLFIYSQNTSAYNIFLHKYTHKYNILYTGRLLKNFLLISFNGFYEMKSLWKMQTMHSTLTPSPQTRVSQAENARGILSECRHTPHRLGDTPHTGLETHPTRVRRHTAHRL
jgi:hypothetical protein